MPYNTLAYYSLPSRAWELFAGAIAATMELPNSRVHEDKIIHRRLVKHLRNG